MLQLTTLIQESTPEIQQKRLISRLRVFAYQKHLSEIETNSRITWILRFIRFHNKQHPADLNQSDIETFLSTLAIEHNYDRSVQSNALSALNFLYEDFLQIKLGTLQYVQTKTRRGFSDRFGNFHCRSVLNHMRGTSLLMAELVVTGKLKLREVINLKLTDINIKKNRIQVRKINGEIKFSLNIPIRLILDLRIQIMRVRQLVQIKTQQFCEIDPKGSSNLSDTLQSPSTLSLEKTVESRYTSFSRPADFSRINKDEYLFPVSNIENPHISSRAMQLALLKNDIQIATKQYLRFSNIAESIPVAANFTKKGKKTDNPDKQTLWALTSSKQNLQASFNFRSKSRLSAELELGAA